MLTKLVQSAVTVSGGVSIFTPVDYRQLLTPVILKPDEFGQMWYWCDSAEVSAHNAALTEVVDGVECQVRAGAFAWSALGIPSTPIVMRGTVEPSVTSLSAPANAEVLVDGSCFFASHLDITLGNSATVRGISEDASLLRCTLKIAATANDVSIRDLRISNALVDTPPTKEGVVLVASQTSTPIRTRVSNVHFDNCYVGLRVRGGKDGVFTDLSAYACLRSYGVYSADACLFERIKSTALIGDDGTIKRPIVGFLNIPDREYSYGRGVTNCTYRDINIDGWTEEGFGFDANGNAITKRALIANAHVTGVTASGITITGTHIASAYTRYDCIFNTGAIAGKRFAISANTETSLTLADVGPHLAQIQVGDFVGVEVQCFGNLVERLALRSIGDRSGVSVWLWGGNTTYDTVSFDGCVACVFGAANNKRIASWNGTNYYGAPHNLTFRNGTFKNQYSIDGRSVDGWIPYDPIQLCGYTFAQETLFDEALLDDESVRPDEMRISGAIIEGALPPKMQLKYVRGMSVPYLRSIDEASVSVDVTEGAFPGPI